MPDEEIVIRTRLEDAGVVPGLEQQARAVADLRRRANAPSGGGGAPGADWMGAPRGLEQFKAQTDAAVARTGQIQRDIAARDVRAATEQAARTSQVGNALSGAGAAARMTGNWQIGTALDALGGLATKLGGAGLAALGVAAGVAALGVAAGKAMWDLGELALKVDTLAREGANAKTSIEQYALAQERIRLGLGRYAAPTVNAFYTQAAGVAATVADRVGNQTPDDAYQNALARERAAQQRLEAARKTWGATPPAVQAEVQQLTYTQMGRYGMGMGTNPFGGLAVTVPQAEAAAAATRLEVANAAIARAMAAQQAIGAAGGLPTRDTAAQLQATTQALAEQKKVVASVKNELAEYDALMERVRVAGLDVFTGVPDAAANLKRLNEQAQTINFEKAKTDLAGLEADLRRLTAQEWQLKVAVRREMYGRDINIIQEGELGGQLPEIASQRVGGQQQHIAVLKQQIANYEALVARVGEAEALKISPVGAQEFKAELKAAEEALLRLQATEYLIKINALVTMPTPEEIQAQAQRMANPTGFVDFGKWAYAQQAYPTSPTLMAMDQDVAGPGQAPGFDTMAAPIDQSVAYLRYRQNEYAVNQQSKLDKVLSRPDAARDYVKPSNAIGKLESTLRGLIGQGPSTAVGLGDLRGGTYGGGPLAPGAGGPFEALYRIQDVAQNWDTPGKDTKKWAEMYGVDKEQAKGISKQFQMGFFSPEVLKHVDTQALVDTANMMDLADKSQEALAKELAKKGANPANIKRLLGVVGKDDKDTSQYKPAIDTMLGGLGTELGNQAGNVEAVGKKWWGLLEKGLTDGAKDSDVLLEVLRSLIRAELNSPHTVPTK